MTIVIRGLVDATGAGGSYEQDGTCSLVFDLAAWRLQGGPPKVEGRRCEFPVPNEDLRAYMDRMYPYSIVDLEFDAIPQDDPEVTLSPLKVVQSSGEDAELAAIAMALQEPIYLDHEVFGRLTYERRFKWFEGRAIWGGKNVTVNIEVSNPSEAAAPLTTAARAFSEHDLWEPALCEALAGYLVPLWNECWRRWWNRTIDKERLLKRTALHSVHFGESGRITFWYSDGGLFRHHEIEVRAYAPRSVSEVCLAG